MPRGIVDEEQHIPTSSDGSFQGTAYARVHELQRLSSMGSRGRNGLSSEFALDAALAIALPVHLQIVGDRQQDLHGLLTDVRQVSVL